MAECPAVNRFMQVRVLLEELKLPNYVIIKTLSIVREYYHI